MAKRKWRTKIGLAFALVAGLGAGGLWLVVRYVGAKHYDRSPLASGNVGFRRRKVCSGVKNRIVAVEIHNHVGEKHPLGYWHQGKIDASRALLARFLRA